MSAPGFQNFDKPLGSTERADYLDTQTLFGGEGYFHTSNDAVNTDQSPESALVLASQGHGQQAHATTPEGDKLEEMTNPQLRDLAAARGVDVEPRANKAALVAALRGE